ncbi:Eukaryotic aspartyl protease family protein [Raphanus sativus]|uniref:Aspartic proteinase CDR1-like n=1 Tax=Raphanus sativus TaxID=3726 RepID=A0A6J0N5A7_RAPSA|nr:aspartic proteinase CDR1-like [Raphanus sativus]KAJ4903165.1 Eukaryotic aspartyl protease family protein [Raphanus sativus]
MSFATRMMSMTLSFQIIAALLFITATASSSTSPSGFTMDLIHRRTNSSSSQRSNTDDQLRSSPYSDLVFDTYEYLMKLQIGTPPVEIEAVLDTGSEHVWTQCLPCLNCYKQRNPIFDPSKSSTYKQKQCNTPNDPSCDYELIYGDKSYSKGSFASETVTLKSTSGQSYVMPKTVIGCSHNSSGFKTTGSGIVGLNWGPLSLISQMGKNMLGAISYCFSPEGTSKINFGRNAIVSGNGTVSTPMFTKKEEPGTYYLNLDAVSVEETRIETLGTPFHAVDGNTVIDSGAAVTYLPTSYCSLVREAVEKFVTAERVTYGDNSLCYKTNTLDVFPVITMHFSGGADLVLDKNNTYMSFGQDICLVILCGAEEAVFGNRAQNNFLVGYDHSSRLVSFKPTDCGVTQDIPRDSISAALVLQFNVKFVFFIFVLSLMRL